MNLRVAVWCPQGRDQLPLAARLCREQLPVDSIVWSSDEANPTPPEEGAVDLWLVLCAGDPPPPPAWREPATGVWAVFPGTAAQWTKGTQTATEAWKPDHVLTDLLSGEMPGALGGEWLDGRPAAWIPSWIADKRSQGRRFPMVVVTDKTVPEWLLDPVLSALAEVHGGFVFQMDTDGAEVASAFAAAVAGAERIIVCSNDPVCTGLTLQQAAASGIEVCIWGRAPLALRSDLLGGLVSEVVPLPDADGRIGPILRRLAGWAHGRRHSRARHVSVGSWAGWAGVLAGQPADPANECAAAADLLAAQKRIRGHCQYLELSSAWERVFPRLGLHELCTRGVPRAVFERLIETPGHFEVLDLVEHLLSVEPTLLSRARYWGRENHAGGLGIALLYGVCDGHVFGWRRQAFIAAEEILSAAGRKNPRVAEWVSAHAYAAATLGQFEAADADIAWLNRHDPSRIVGVLHLVLRAWVPGLEWAEPDVLPRGAAAWWREQVARLAIVVPGQVRVLVALGGVRFGEVTPAEEEVVRAHLSEGARASMAVQVWLGGDAARANRWWAPDKGAGVAASVGEQFAILCARALLGDGGAQIVPAMQELGETTSNWFGDCRPSHSRCFWRALVHQRMGDEAGALEWWDRAEKQDPLTRFRRVRFAAVGPRKGATNLAAHELTSLPCSNISHQ